MTTALDQFRAEKDTLFRDHPHSPLDRSERESFRGLQYYPENPGLVFDVEPQLFDPPELVEMQTSTGDDATYLRWGRVTFAVDGQEASLPVYRDPGSGSLFLPFQDASAGGETYGAGRYLEVEELPGGRLHLDFNYAYNPYCAYGEGWSCPIPLAENRLRVAIRAGEKTYH